MVKSNKSNLKEEKRLAEEVRNFPCLYDKGNRLQRVKLEKGCRLRVENSCGYNEGT